MHAIRSLVLALTAACAAPAAAQLSVAPREVVLEGPEAAQQLAATLAKGPLAEDVTGSSVFASREPGIAWVGRNGLVTPVKDGATRIFVRRGGLEVSVRVTVRNHRVEPPRRFVADVVPILVRSGCNSGPCHGKAEGQAGFKLSVFGYDPESDHRAITREALGRRVNRAEPGRSLLLLKATGTIPHGGGRRFAPGSRHYLALARWIAAGAPFGETPRLTALEVEPRERAVAPKASQRLVVTARYEDGTVRDVTREARFGTNAPAIAEVDENGLAVTTGRPGEAALMVMYGGEVTVSRLMVPRPGAKAPPPPPSRTSLDPLVWGRLRQLGISPSPPADDATFLRRASLDITGALPSIEEARAFLQDRDPEKRRKLVDRLLERPEYADYWALKWSDLLRVNREKLGAKGAHSFYQWIRTAVAENRPYDRFIRELLTASGSSTENGAVNLFRVLAKPQELAASVSQVFLGVRIECAECHHHPFERWSQDDYYGLVGFFTGLKARGAPAGATVVTPAGAEPVIHPRTKAPVPPHPLLGAPVDPKSAVDLREALAAWMTDPANRFVPRMIANRLWAHFMGRGLVEPVDDFRDTNPPSNPALLDALAEHLVRNGYDLKALIRLITGSQVYQLSGTPNATNADDEQNFSRAYPRRLSAEVLLDAISSASGSPAEFAGLPRGTRAVQIWDSEWYLQWQSYFLNAFGRPPRTSPCECERSQEPTIAQVLHLMNAPEIQAQIADPNGLARRLADSGRPDDAVIEDLFLAAYSRLPTTKERVTARELFAGRREDRTGAAEDLLWALLNSVEFTFNH